VEKVYRARVMPPHVSERALAALRDGVELDDGLARAARVRSVSSGLLEIAIREGRKRQVRRMCSTVGHEVVELERVRFGPLRLGGLAPGAHRRLTAPEVEQLRAAAQRTPA
jgi:pseudouridine synthase